MPSSVTSTSSICTACAACPGYIAGSGVDDDDESDLDPNEDDVASDIGSAAQNAFIARRSLLGDESKGSSAGQGLAGRFYYIHRGVAAPLRKRAEVTSLGTCDGLKLYNNKPGYPVADKVKNFEWMKTALQDGKQEELDRYIARGGIYVQMNNFYPVAKYWLIPQDIAPGDCSAPGYDWLETNEITKQNRPDVQLPAIWRGKYDLSPKQKRRDQLFDRYVDIDHVYETHLLREFFDELITGSQRSCPQIEADWDVAIGGGPASDHNSRLNDLFKLLPTYDHPEFVGMYHKLNSLKNIVWKTTWVLDKEPIDLNTHPANPAARKAKDKAERTIDNVIFDLTELMMLMDAWSHPDLVKLLDITNTRIYTALKKFDQRCDPFKYATLYRDYLTQRIIAKNVDLQAFLNKAMAKLLPVPDPQGGPPPPSPPYAVRLSSLGAKYPIASMTIPAFDWEAPPDVEALGSVWKRAGEVCDGGTSSPAARVTSVSAKPLAQVTSLAPVTSVTAKALAQITSVAQVTFVTSKSLAQTPASPAAHTSATATAAAQPAASDKCGPAVQAPGSMDTCDAEVAKVQSPSSYGVSCDESTGTPVSAYECQKAYTDICSSMVFQNFPHAAWAWVDNGAGCAVGIWMPNPDQAAMVPTTERCETQIFQAMVTECQGASVMMNTASVNINQLPSFADTSDTGIQMNSGYMSYIIADKAPSGLNKAWMGWTTSSNPDYLNGAGIARNSNNQPEPAVPGDSPDVCGDADGCVKQSSGLGGEINT